jgi:hypothetical protein
VHRFVVGAIDFGYLEQPYITNVIP